MAVSGRYLCGVAGLLTTKECKKFIKRLDRGELEHVDRGNANYDRNMYVSAEFAAKVFARIAHLLPPDVAAEGHCNDHFRFSKYVAGQAFGVHRDDVKQDATGARSEYTVNIFLNDDFEGGETDFLCEENSLAYRATPRAGLGVVFDRNIIHRGNMIVRGVKYLLRTDVMMNREKAARDDVARMFHASRIHADLVPVLQS